MFNQDSYTVTYIVTYRLWVCGSSRVYTLRLSTVSTSFHSHLSLIVIMYATDLDTEAESSYCCLLFTLSLTNNANGSSYFKPLHIQPHTHSYWPVNHNSKSYSCFIYAAWLQTRAEYRLLSSNILKFKMLLRWPVAIGFTIPSQNVAAWNTSIFVELVMLYVQSCDPKCKTSIISFSFLFTRAGIGSKSPKNLVKN